MNMLSDGDRQFLASFEAFTLTAAGFGHREHVRLAYCCLAQEPFEAAAARVATGLRRFLQHLGAPASKYHETQTHAWLLAVQHFMRTAGTTDSFEAFLNTGARLLDREVMETHYTRGRLHSDAARSQFLEPDLAPIPRYAG